MFLLCLGTVQRTMGKIVTSDAIEKKRAYNLERQKDAKVREARAAQARERRRARNAALLQSTAPADNQPTPATQPAATGTSTG